MAGRWCALALRWTLGGGGAEFALAGRARGVGRRGAGRLEV